jgi:peptidoglycan/LPS O-acetylase OafA/YrhL
MGGLWKLGHRPALDGIRGIAILLVMVAHLAQYFGIAGLDGGGISGVTLFFVLSGFLITALLVEEHQERGRISLGAFYKRRALRLFPALAFLIACVAAYAGLAEIWPEISVADPEGLSGIPGSALAAGLYAANWVRLSGDTLGHLSHTWSLSIEEQFYIFWPLLLIVAAPFAPRRWRIFLGVVIGAAVASELLRLVLWDGPGSINRVSYGTDARVDALLIGCVLALWVTADRRAPTARWLAVAGVALLAAATTFNEGLTAFVLAPTAAALGGAALIALVAGGWSPAWLTWRPLTGTGRISYGLYLWHIPIFAELLIMLSGEPWPIRAGVPVVASYAAALFSYQFIEKPFLRLKRRQSRVRDEEPQQAPRDAQQAARRPRMGVAPS